MPLEFWNKLEPYIFQVKSEELETIVNEMKDLSRALIGPFLRLKGSVVQLKYRLLDDLDNFHRRLWNIVERIFGPEILLFEKRKCFQYTSEIMVERFALQR